MFTAGIARGVRHSKSEADINGATDSEEKKRQQQQQQQQSPEANGAASQGDGDEAASLPPSGATPPRPSPVRRTSTVSSLMSDEATVQRVLEDSSFLASVDPRVAKVLKRKSDAAARIPLACAQTRRAAG